MGKHSKERPCLRLSKTNRIMIIRQKLLKIFEILSHMGFNSYPSWYTRFWEKDIAYLLPHIIYWHRGESLVFEAISGTPNTYYFLR